MQGEQSTDAEKQRSGDKDLRQADLDLDLALDEMTLPPESLAGPQITAASGYLDADSDSTMPSMSSVKDLRGMTNSAERSLVGEFVEQYQLTQVLGKGGMSVVYKAEHSILHNTVAVKTMHAHLVSDSQAVMRFKQEAQAATQLDHPNVIKVTGFGITTGDNAQPYIIMDYIEGHSLSDVLKHQGRLQVASVLKIFIQICNALQHAHNKGVIHRDLKPSNIMLLQREGDADFVKIVDFGIAKLLTQEGEQAHRLTQTGDVFGSPMYMSPEQCMGRTVDKRSDVYALGCVLYETLSGKPPHHGNNVFETFHKHITEIPASLDMPTAEKALIERLDAIVFRALEKDPEKRYQTMAQFEADLRSVQENLDSGLRGTGIQSKLASQQRSLARFLRSAPKSAVIIVLATVFFSATACAFWAKCSWFCEPRNDFGTPQTHWLNYLPSLNIKQRLSDSAKQEILDNEKNALQFARLNHSPESPYMLKLWKERARSCAELDAPAEEIEARTTIVKLLTMRSKNGPDYGMEAGQLAECLIAQGDFRGALPLLKDAVFIREQMGSSFTDMNTPRINLELGYACLNLAKYSDAAVELQEAAKQLTLRGNGGRASLNVADSRQLAIIYAVQGDMYRQMNRWEDADKSYENSEALMRSSKFKRAGLFLNELSLVRAYVNLRAGNYAVAEKFFESGLPYAQERYTYEKDQQQLVLNGYAYSAWQAHEWFKAIQLRDQSVTISASTPSK